MITDFHTYVGTSLLGYALPPEDCLAQMRTYGVAAAVVCPMKGLDPHYSEPNSFVSQLQNTYPGVFHGYARVNPHLNTACAVLRQAFDDLHLKGLLLHPWEETFAVNDPKVFPLVEAAAERNLPVMVETGYPLLSHPLQVADLAGRYPETTFIMTHGGQLDSSGFSMTDAEYVMRRYENLIMETSGFFADELLENLAIQLGPHRLVFGSHSPWLHLGLEIKRVERTHLADIVKAEIFSGTAQRLLQRQALRA